MYRFLFAITLLTACFVNEAASQMPELPSQTYYLLVKSRGTPGLTVVSSDEFAIKTGKKNVDAAYFEHKTVLIPADTKLETGGEDAAASSSSDNMLVVADGVGGWSLQGIDAGIFSQRLTEAIVEDHIKSPNNNPVTHV